MAGCGLIAILQRLQDLDKKYCFTKSCCVQIGRTKVMYEQMLTCAPHIEFRFGTRASLDGPSTPVSWADPSGVASSCKPCREHDTCIPHSFTRNHSTERRHSLRDLPHDCGGDCPSAPRINQQTPGHSITDCMAHQISSQPDRNISTTSSAVANSRLTCRNFLVVQETTCV
jgi:hypothetical protein